MRIDALLLVATMVVAPREAPATQPALLSCPAMVGSAGDTPEVNGEKLRKSILCNLMPIRDKFATARNAAHSANLWNAFVSAIGGIVAGVTKASTAKWVGVGTAGVGAVIALVAGSKTQDAQVVSCMKAIDQAVTDWDLSAKDVAAFKAFRTAVQTQVNACPELGDLNNTLAPFMAL